MLIFTKTQIDDEHDIFSRKRCLQAIIYDEEKEQYKIDNQIVTPGQTQLSLWETKLTHPLSSDCYIFLVNVR